MRSVLQVAGSSHCVHCLLQRLSLGVLASLSTVILTNRGPFLIPFTPRPRQIIRDTTASLGPAKPSGT